MAGEANQNKWVGVRPVNPAENIPVDVKTLSDPDVNIEKIGGTIQTGRDVTQDTRALIDDAIKGLMRSMGDSGVTPVNATGKTILKILTDILTDVSGADNENIWKWGGTTVTGRDVTRDLQALRDPDFIGLFGSFGDAGATPNNFTGDTLLYIVDAIRNSTRSLNPDTGTQITKSNSCVNTAVIIHTVTAGKTLYMSTATLSFRCNAAPEMNTILYVRDTGDATIYTILKCTANTDMGEHANVSFPCPIKIPAGYDICIISSNVDAHGDGFIHGWEE